jgi:excinuclease UvrABC nuclease subunit
VRLGPYRSAGVLDACIEALGKIFPLRRCKKGEGDSKACLYGQMGRCAPCNGTTPAEYREEVVDEIAALLRGEGGEEHLAALVRERDRLAVELEFESAARLRDLISGIERVRLARSVVRAEGVSAVVAPSTEPGMIEAFALAEGRLVAHSGFEPHDATGLTAFARGVLAGRPSEPQGRRSADEARIVAAYLRRRQVPVEAVRLDEEPGVEGLISTARRIAGRVEEGEESAASMVK